MHSAIDKSSCLSDHCSPYSCTILLYLEASVPLLLCTLYPFAYILFSEHEHLSCIPRKIALIYTYISLIPKTALKYPMRLVAVSMQEFVRSFPPHPPVREIPPISPVGYNTMVMVLCKRGSSKDVGSASRCVVSLVFEDIASAVEVEVRIPKEKGSGRRATSTFMGSNRSRDTVVVEVSNEYVARGNRPVRRAEIIARRVASKAFPS